MKCWIRILTVCLVLVSQLWFAIPVFAVVPPVVGTKPPTGILATSANGQGIISSTGLEDDDFRGFAWGISTGVYTSNVTESGSFGIGTFSLLMTGLIPNTTYYYVAMAHNSSGWGYGTEEVFATLVMPLAPVNLIFTDAGSSTVDLTWAKGASANNTIIRVSRSTYPISITDGENVYSSSGTSTWQSGLSLDTTTYYYSAWSELAGIYSSGYTTAQIGGANMIFLGFLALPLVMTFIAFRSRMIGVYALGTAAWVALWFYVSNSGIPGVTKGSSTESAVMLICIGASIMVLLVGLGNWRSQKQASNGVVTESEGWHMPKWLKGEEEPSRSSRSESVEQYRARISGAYRRGRGK